MMVIFGLGFALGRKTGREEGSRGGTEAKRIRILVDESRSSGSGSHASLDKEDSMLDTPLTYFEELNKTQKDFLKDRGKAAESPVVEKHPPPRKKEAPHNRKGSPYYTIQVASFRDKEDALRLVKRLKAAGFGQAMISRAFPDGKNTWYRVRIGRFEDIKDAKRKAWIISMKARVQPLIIRLKD